MPEEIPIFVFADSTKRTYGYDVMGQDMGFRDARTNTVFSLTCPYCCLGCKSDRVKTNWGVTGWVEDRFACCPRCGWWSFERDSDDTNEQPSYLSIAAIMKMFDFDSPDIPIDPLAAYIAQRQELIHRIHPAKLEELVGAIYSEVLGYRVERCSYGRPDKGIDLVVVNTHDGRTLAIQVKRYTQPIELGMIHQFFGAMVDDDRKQGVFVTSGRFRSGAMAVADSLQKKTQVEIDLVDGKRLLEFIGILNASHRRPKAMDFDFWMNHPYFGSIKG